MPTYDFRCPAGHEFERFYRKISDAPETVECPTCRAVAQRRVSGGAGLHFKGSGFYITDYGKDGKKNQRSAPSSSTTSKESTSSSGEGSSSAGGGEAAKPAEPSAPAKGSDSSE